jgi:hypothetical protein
MNRCITGLTCVLVVCLIAAVFEAWYKRQPIGGDGIAAGLAVLTILCLFIASAVVAGRVIRYYRIKNDVLQLVGFVISWVLVMAVFETLVFGAIFALVWLGGVVTRWG